jgi:iron complex transport system ATP-binding protein
MKPQGEPRLVARGLRVRLGETGILNGVDLAVRSGELVAIIGPNGAGKTTLLRCLDGIVAPDSGSIEIDGRPLDALNRRELARMISYVPQTELAADGYTVREFVEMGRFPHLAGWAALTADDRQAVEEALVLTGTGHLESRLLSTLSGGERQRVWIAAALAQGGTILLLDEPTSFLDVRHQIQVLDLLDRLHNESGYTVVAVTHDLNGLVADAETVVALDAGRVVFSGSPAELLTADALTRVFASEFVLLDGGRHGLPVVLPRRNGS